MGFQSFALLILLFASLSACVPAVTQSAVPAIAGPTGGPNSCGGCYVVADVAAVYFGDIVTQTYTAHVSIGITPNGTNITIATVITPAAAPFTVYPSSLEPGSVSIDFNGPTVTYNGATLISPTPYDVFTAYSVTSTVFTDGSCLVMKGSAVPLATAYSVARPSDAGADFDSIAEQSFITHGLSGYPSCSGGGVNPAPTTITPSTATLTVPFTTIATYKPTLSVPAVPIVTVGTATSTTTATTTATSTLVSSTGTTTVTVTATSTIPVISPIVSALSLPNGTATEVSTVSSKTIIIVSNTTFLETGVGPTVTIIPYTPGSVATWQAGFASSWLSWSAGISSIVLLLWSL